MDRALGIQSKEITLRNDKLPIPAFYLAFVTFLSLCFLTAFAQVARADLGASVTVGSTGNIDPLENKDLIITLSNSDAVNPLTAVSFSNSLPGTLPDGLFVNGAPTYVCTDPSGPTTTAGVGTLSATGQSISLSGGVIPAASGGTSANCQITIPVTAGTSTGNVATYVYTIADSSVSGNDGAGTIQNTGAVSQSIVVNAMDAPSITTHTVQGGNTLILGGSDETLFIRVSNTNAFDIPNFSFSNIFPLISGNPAFHVFSTPGTSATCNNGGAAPTFSPSAGDTSLSFSGTLPAASGGTDGYCTFLVQVEGLRTGGVYQTSASNQILASSWSDDIGIGLNSNSNRTVTLRSPLDTNINFANNELATGQSDVMEIVFSNNATSAINISSFSDAQIDDNTAAGYGLTVNGTPTVNCTGGGTNGSIAVTGASEGFTWTGGAIAPGSICTITVNFTGTVQTAGVPITYTNTINQGDVSAGAIAGETIINEGASDSILVGDNIRVSIEANPSTAAAGNPIRYEATVENFGAAAIPNVTILDALPAGQTLLTGTIGGLDFTPSMTGCGGLTETNTLGETNPSFTIGSLPGRVDVNTTASCVVTYWVQSDPAGGSDTNELPVGSVTFSGGSNQVASNSVTVNEIPALAMVNSFSPSSTFEGTDSLLTITFSNWTAQALANLSFTHTLPVGSLGGQLFLASTPAATSTCSGAVITANPGDTSISLSGAAVPARASSGLGSSGSCLLQFRVVGAAGVYSNTINATADATPANGGPAVGVAAASNAASLTYTSALSASKLFNPTAIFSGGEAQAIIRFANSGTGALTGVAVTDNLPAGMTLTAAPNAYTTCAGPTSITAVGGAGSIDLSGATVAAGGTCDLVFDVTATGGAPWTNTISTGGVTADGGVINVNPFSATLGLLPAQSLLVSEFTSPSTLSFPGEVSRLTIDITNGSNPVSNLSLTDFFTSDGLSGSADNGIIISGTPAVSTTCTGGTVTATPGGNSVTLTGASMTASEVCQYSVNVTSVQAGGITNFIPVGSITTAEGYTNGNQATTSITTQSNIGVTKQFDPQTVAIGERSRLTITLYNPASSPITALSINDNFPAGITIPPGANPTTTCAGGTISTAGSNQVSLTGGVLGAASGTTPATCVLEVDVVTAATGDFVNTINAGEVSGSASGSPVSNTAPATDRLRSKAALEVQISIVGETLDTVIQTGSGNTTGSAFTTAGTPETLSIRLRNTNATPLTGVAFNDILPSGLVLSTAPNEATTCTGGTVNAAVSGTSIQLTGATIPANGACTVTADVLSNVSGSYIDDIPVGAISSTEGVTNAEETRAEIIIADPPTIDLSYTPPVIAPGGTSMAMITLGNPNPQAITLTSQFTHNLPISPGSILVDGTPGIVTDCPGTVTAAANGATISYGSGDTIPAGGCKITVNITGTTPGDYTGVIPTGDLQTNVGPNPAPATADLAISTQGYISGQVWADGDATAANGVFNSGIDTALGGVTIELHAAANCAGAASQSTTTDGLGNYLFFPLSAGTYSVCEPSQPAGTENGTTTAGSIRTVGASTGSAGTASNPTATSSEIVNIILGSNSGDTSGSPDNDFAEVALSSIAGNVFLDVNNNGVRNGADTAFVGETIELLDNLGGLITSTTTDSNGDYAFTGLSPDTYSVRQPNQPANSSDGIVTPGSVPNGGTPGTGTAVGVSPSQISTIVLPPNAASTGNDFAEVPNSRTLSGRVFFDFDNSGTMNGSDYGLGGETISITGPVTRSTTTAADGTYAFLDLPSGTYTIDQPNQPANTTNGITTAGSTGGTATNPTATSSQIASVDLTGGNTVSANNDFAEVPGPAPDLTVTITHSPASFAEGNDQGKFTVTGANVGSVDSSGPVTIVTTLPAGITPTGGMGTGWSCAVSGQNVTCTSTDVIATGGTAQPIMISTLTGTGLAGQVLTATAVISDGGELLGSQGNNTDTDPVPISASASVAGTIWQDINHDRVLDAGEPLVSGWTVELLDSTNAVVASATTDASGAYLLANLIPGSGYEVRFREPTNGAIFGRPVPNESGATFTNGAVNATNNPAGADNSSGTLTGLTLAPGTNTVEQSLPLDPAGVVYNSVTREPVSGAVVTISGPAGFVAADVVGGSTSVTTGADGFYQFLLNATAPSGTYRLAVNEPGGYQPAPSQVIAACTNSIVVSAVPDPSLVQDDNLAPVQGSAIHDPATCPATSAGFNASNQASTQYYFDFDITIPTSANIVNNHIPLDPILTGVVAMTKTTPRVDVTRGSVVPYTITARNSLSNALPNLDIVDQMPPGFAYRTGTASIDGVAIEPSTSGRTLRWPAQNFAGGETKTIKLMLIVSAGVGDGEYVNETWAESAAASTIVSNIASATVRLGTDPLFDCSDIIGRVFTDSNANGVQDNGEVGISGVTLVTARGTLITTDAAGRYNVPCAEVPNAYRGSNFILKVDERTLPLGYQMVCGNPKTVRVTRGKLAKMNFGAAPFRVVRMELFDDAFEPDGTGIGMPLSNALRNMPAGVLSDAPSSVLLQHMGQSPLAEQRLANVANALRSGWDQEGSACYPLRVQSEIKTLPATVKGAVK